MSTTTAHGTLPADIACSILREGGAIRPRTAEFVALPDIDTTATDTFPSTGYERHAASTTDIETSSSRRWHRAATRRSRLQAACTVTMYFAAGARYEIARLGGDNCPGPDLPHLRTGLDFLLNTMQRRLRTSGLGSLAGSKGAKRGLRDKVARQLSLCRNTREPDWKFGTTRRRPFCMTVFNEGRKHPCDATKNAR